MGHRMEEQGDKEPVVIIWHVNFPVARLMVTCTNLWSLEVEDLVVGEALVCFNTLMFVSLLDSQGHVRSSLCISLSSSFTFHLFLIFSYEITRSIGTYLSSNDVWGGVLFQNSLSCSLILQEWPEIMYKNW